MIAHKIRLFKIILRRHFYILIFLLIFMFQQNERASVFPTLAPLCWIIEAAVRGKLLRWLFYLYTFTARSQGAYLSVLVTLKFRWRKIHKLLSKRRLRDKRACEKNIERKCFGIELAVSRARSTSLDEFKEQKPAMNLSCCLTLEDVSTLVEL